MTKRERRKLIKGNVKKLWPIIEKSAKKSLEKYLNKEIEKLSKK